jgi:dihydroflavonol-4-reductase
MKKAKKVLVTGADGLLGSNVVRELLEQGHRVRVLVQPGSLSPALKGLPIRVITGDLLYDLEELQKAVSGCDTVIHCAALTSFSANPDLVQRVNVEGTKNIMDACLDRGVGRFIHVGSASSFQFGSLEDPGTEEGDFPEVYERITYMRSKYEAMNLVKKYVQSYDLDAVIVAPTFMFGPHDARPSSGEMIRQFIIRNMVVTSPGGRNFVHVRDVARAIVAAQEKGRRGESYILGGENLSYLDFFSIAAKITGKKPPRAAVPKFIVIAGGMAATAYQGLAGKRLVFNLSIAVSGSLQAYYSSNKAERELGLTHTPIEKAIGESIQSLVDYGHLEEKQWNN